MIRNLISLRGLEKIMYIMKTQSNGVWKVVKEYLVHMKVVIGQQWPYIAKECRLRSCL